MLTAWFEDAFTIIGVPSTAGPNAGEIEVARKMQVSDEPAGTITVERARAPRLPESGFRDSAHRDGCREESGTSNQ